MGKASDNLRESFGRNDDIRDAGLSTPDTIVRYDDILYGTDEKWQKLDVYRPKAAGDDKLPVIVSIHGGGWVYGDKERYQYYCMNLAERGFAVVNFTYRLAPDFKFPAPLEDANLVMTWIMNNAEVYNMDVERIFAVGDSAGGQQLALYSSICTNPEYAPKYDFKVPDGFSFRAVALNCGAYITDVNDKTIDTGALMAEYLPNQGDEEEIDMISVCQHISPDFPPAFVMTATGDFLRNQAPELVKKLIENNIEHELHYYGDREHELGHVFHLDIRSEYAKKCNDEETEFFRKYM